MFTLQIFYFTDQTLPEVMFSIQVPLQTNQLPHGRHFQYPSCLEKNKNKFCFHFFSTSHQPHYFWPNGLWLYRITVVLYLSLVTAHDELQHWHAVGPWINLRQVIQARGQRAQTPLDYTPFVNQVLKCLRETQGIMAVRTGLEKLAAPPFIWGFSPWEPSPSFTHHNVSLFGCQFKRCKASVVGHHVEWQWLVQLCIACHNQVNGLARKRLVGLQNQNVKHCVA